VPLPAQSNVTSAPFPFDRDFQIGILALAVQDPQFTSIAMELIEPAYFEDQKFVWFWQKIKAFHDKYNSAPTFRVVQNELAQAARLGTIKAAQIGEFASIGKQLALPVNDAAYIQAELVKFCRRQVGKKTWLETAPLMDTADDDTWDSIVDKIQKIPTIGLGLANSGIDPLTWTLEQDPPRLAFGIHEVDEVLRGGLKPGQLGALIGGPGSGKSLGLLHIGVQQLFRRNKVLYISLELGENDIAERFTAAVCRIPLNELHHSTARIAQRQENLQVDYKSLFKIKFFPTATVNTIKAYLRSLAGQGWRPEMLLVDYGDLLSVVDSKGSDYADQGNAFNDLRILAGYLGIPCWTATQANRGAFQAEKVGMEHVADSMRKSRICDVLVGISAKPDERDKQQARLNFAKNRNGRENLEVVISTNYAMAQFCDTNQTGQLANLANQGGTTPPGMPVPVATTRKAKKS